MGERPRDVEAPWLNARVQWSAGDKRAARFTKGSMQDFYKELSQTAE